MKRLLTWILLAAGLCVPLAAGSAPPARHAIEAEVRRTLKDALSDGEIARVLRHEGVKASLRASFDGWDGAHDTVRLQRGAGDTITLEVTVKGLRRTCAATLGLHELGTPEAPTCWDEVVVTHQERLPVHSDVWQRPRRARRRPAAPEGVSNGPADTVLRAYDRLPASQRRVLEGFARDAMIASRFPSAAGAIAQMGHRRRD